MIINFSTDLVNVFVMKQKIGFTALLYHCIPIGNHVQSSRSLRSRNFEEKKSFVS